MVKISFVIVTYNSEELIKDCISSIYYYADLDQSEFEIIIVDNSNEEGHIKLKNITNLFENVKVIHNSQNTGYGAGNNIGIKASSGQIISIMNPDVRIKSSLMQYTLSKFDDNNLALLGYKQLGGLNYSFYPRPEFRKTYIDGILLKKRNKNNKFNTKEDFLSGAFLFIDRDKFNEIGLFDEKIFMYNEESDICKRFIDKNFRIVFDSKISYYHLITERPFSLNAYKNELISLDYYLSKFQIDKKIILKKTLKEIKFKKMIFKLLMRKNDVKRFDLMIKSLNEVFNVN